MSTPERLETADESPARELHGRRRLPAWVFALLGAVLLALVGGGAFLASANRNSDSRQPRSEPADAGQTAAELAKIEKVRQGLSEIQASAEGYKRMIGPGTYPSVSTVEQWQTGADWPTNPYTGLPMAQGTGPGEYDYTYLPASGTDAMRYEDGYELVAYGPAGETIVPASPSPGPQ